MLTIPITEKIAIQVGENEFAVAKRATLKKKDHPDTKVWQSYLYPSSMDRAIKLVTQKLIAEDNREITMDQFNKNWDQLLELIYKKIDGAKEGKV